jgi:hypothetical protein
MSSSPAFGLGFSFAEHGAKMESKFFKRTRQSGSWSLQVDKTKNKEHVLKLAPT